MHSLRKQRGAVIEARWHGRSSVIMKRGIDGHEEVNWGEECMLDREQFYSNYAWSILFYFSFYVGDFLKR